MEEVRNNNSSRIYGGLIIIGVGLVFLLRNFGYYIPDWIFSWHTLLIIIGLLIGYKRNFNGGGWIIMVLIGVFFTVREIVDFDISKYYFPLIFILLGLMLLLKPKKSDIDRGKRCKARWKNRMRRKYETMGDLNIPGDDINNPMGNDRYAGIDKNDIVESVSVFGGNHRQVYSKNFKGGEVVAVVGGSDINLTQADFEGVIRMDVVAVFGGVKIVVPPGWEVRSEVTAIFGGLDDRRTLGVPAVEPRKILIIEGVAMFGGVDIRNF
jgi:predicted membrane protein